MRVLVRDAGLARQVWANDIGYPGDGAYLDFHKRHLPGRHRYWKITDSHRHMADKDLYYPDDAERFRVPEHAGHYKWLLAQSLRAYRRDVGRPGLAVVAFDTELLGHWWFEGPQWLYLLLKWLHADPEIETVTAGEALQRCPPESAIDLAESSWGHRSDHSTWLNADVEWVWGHVYHAEREMAYLAQAYANGRADGTLRRILNQAAREACLLMASDWPFMITTWSTRDVAERRAHEHHADFERLAGMAWAYGQGRHVNPHDWQFLAECEARDRLLTAPELARMWPAPAPAEGERE
jgi:1,4-alpha-glucan branching enzyme